MLAFRFQTCLAEKVDHRLDAQDMIESLDAI